MSGVTLLGQSRAFERAAESNQLPDRHVGVSVGGGITPPYPPSRLANILELNGTHAICVAKKAKREVGFGFELVPHPRADDPGDIPEVLDEFWFGRETTWKIGPRGTVANTAAEVFEKSRQDFHAIGWLALEFMYTGSDDVPGGIAHVPSRTVRIRKSDGQRGGHGFVQERGGSTVFFARAGDRHRTDLNGDPDPIFVDRNTGESSSNPDVLGEVANELLFIPNPHPNADDYGIPPWVSEIQTMVGDTEAKRFNREFFEYDSIPQYAIIVEGGRLTEESRQAVTDMISDLREQDGRRVAVLEAEELAEKGVDIDGQNELKIRLEPLTQQGEEDMSFGSYRDMNKHDIAKVHEVPPQLIGDMGDSNRSNIKEAIRDFTKDVIEPAQERFAGRLYRIVHQLIFDIDDWTIDFVTRGAENERERAEVGQVVVDSVGDAMTVREVRELHGLEGQPGWMDDALANSLLSELSPAPTPGFMIDDALDDAVGRAEAAARTEARVLRGRDISMTGVSAD